VRGKLRIVAATGAAALLAAGCGSSAAPSGGGASTSPPSGGAAGAVTKACMVVDTGGVNDKSFNQSSWEGMQEAAAANSHVTIQYLPSHVPTDYAKDISAFLTAKCSIIVTVGFTMAAATEQAAKANPTQKFAIVDCSYASLCLSGTKLTNIDQLVFNTVQDAFLAGYLSAGMTKTGVVATYGGQQFGTVTIYMDGYVDGVQYYNSKHHTNVKVLGWDYATQKGVFAGNFTDVTAGVTIANTFIGDKADIIFPVAGAVGLGTAKAIQTADQAGKSISMLWVDTDGCISAAAYCQYFLSSVEKGLQTAVKTAVLSAASGTFSGGTYVGTLANGGAQLAPLQGAWTTKVPSSLQAELAQVKAGIENGSIPTPTKNPV
jgi:basic membrane protein A and related proteins